MQYGVSYIPYPSRSPRVKERYRVYVRARYSMKARNKFKIQQPLVKARLSPLDSLLHITKYKHVENKTAYLGMYVCV